MANKALNLKAVNGRPKSSPSACSKSQFAFDFDPNKDGVSSQRGQGKAVAGRTGASSGDSTQVPSQLPATPVCVITGWGTPSPLGNCELSRKEGKAKAKHRGMARDGKYGWGWWVGETTLINSGMAFRMETEFAPPAGLTFPGTGPTPSRTESQLPSWPLQADSQASRSSPGSQPRSHSCLVVPQSLPVFSILGPLWLSCSDPIPTHPTSGHHKKDILVVLALGVSTSFFYKWASRLRDGQSITLGHTAKSRQIQVGKIPRLWPLTWPLST